MKYVIGDIHVRKEEPFFEASSNLFEYLKESILKKGDSLFILGDIFHYSKPSPKEYELVIRFLLYCKEKGIDIFILSGNHDYNATQNTFSTDPLVEFCTIINDPFTVMNFTKYIFVFLPWVSPFQIKNYAERYMSLNDFYSEYIPKTDKATKVLSESEKVFLFYHFPDETINFGDSFQGIDLSFYEEASKSLTRIGGDIHTQRKNYIGTPYQTRYDEKGQVGKIYIIHDDGHQTSLDLPTFINYKDIKYGETVDKTINFPILTVTEAPSTEAAYELYKNFTIRKIETTVDLERVISKEADIESNLKKLLDDFLTINSVDKNTSNYLKDLVI